MEYTTLFIPVQKKINIGGPRLLSFKACLQAWPLPGVWELGSQNIPGQHLTNKGSSLCLDSANNVVYSEHLLPFGESGILVYARWKVPPGPPSAGFLMHFPGLKHYIILLHFLLLG